MVEATPAQVAAVVVRLPGAFDQLRLDAQMTETETELRVQGVTFKEAAPKQRYVHRTGDTCALRRRRLVLPS
jgi:hypothetical protein